jgi:hypothetical protein
LKVVKNVVLHFLKKFKILFELRELDSKLHS